MKRLDIAQLETMEDAQVASEIRRAVAQLLADDPFPLTHEERARLAQELEFEILGLGPLEPLVRDNTISDILVNRFDEVFIERFGHLELTDVKFRDNAHLMKIINKIVSNIGRRIDESSPMVDARLPDGSRVNAVIPPLALDGPLPCGTMKGLRNGGQSEICQICCGLSSQSIRLVLAMWTI